MASLDSLSIVLRFRDLVTELGGTIAEHRRLVRQHGYVWWGWWRRQAEHIPRETLADLFGSAGREVEVLLFDAGTLQLYTSMARRIAIAPSVVGIQTPEFEGTPEYYVRGHYPVWVRLERDIAPSETAALRIVSRPTAGEEFDTIPEDISAAGLTFLKALRDERPTLWIVARE